MVIAEHRDGTPVGVGHEQHHRSALVLVTILFFAWGFLTVLNDILVPHLKAIFALSYTGVMFVQFSFFLAYFLLALPSGKLIDYIGYKRSMVIGLLTMGAGALLFVPAASLPSYPIFLAALFVLASGMTVLQVSANPYIAILGSPEGASSRLNLAQAFNSLGTMLAPLIGGALILTEGVRSASSVKLPYMAFAGVLFLLAAVVAASRLPAPSSAEQRGDRPEGSKSLRSAWHARHLVLGAGAIFVYCGAEVSIGSFLVNFLGQPDIGGLTERSAAHYVSFYWTGAMIGRFAGAALLRKIPANRALAGFSMMASALVCLTILSSGHIALWAIIAVGLFNSIMFPSIFALGIEGLGPLTGQGSGILIMAILGAAVLPVAQGALADHIGIHRAFILPAICYLYVAFYGLRGFRREGSTPLAQP
jgi:MFS transporter, FHS family, L-fucose permease